MTSLPLILPVQGSKTQLSSSEVQSLAKKRESGGSLISLPKDFRLAPRLDPPAGVQVWLREQVSASDALRPRSPAPDQLSSLREPGTQDAAGPQAPKAAQTGTATHGCCCHH